MKRWMVMVMSAAVTGALMAPAGAQGVDGVPGDRLVVPLPDVSGLDDAQAQDLMRELAQMNVITSECPDHDVSDPEWQLMTDTTDALMARLGIDAITYDREYFRPAFSLMDDPASCDTLGPQAPALIERLEAMGGSAQPVTPPPEPPLEVPAGDAGAAPAEAAPAETLPAETAPAEAVPAE